MFCKLLFGKDHTMDENEIRLFCYFSYLGPFWLIGLTSDFVFSKTLRFHINQGIGLFICEMMMALLIISVYFLTSGAVRAIAVTVLSAAAAAVSVVLSYKGMMNVYNSRKENVTFLGIIEFLPIGGGRS